MAYYIVLVLLVSACSLRVLRGSLEANTVLSPRYAREALQRECFPQLEPETKWCTYQGTRTSSSTTGWWWGGRTEYYIVSYTYEKCCPGYGGATCQAMCHEEPMIDSCNINEGLVIHKDGEVTSCSGGACVKPNYCKDCNTGYYSSDDGYCRACNVIDHCNIPRCNDGTDSVCSWCDGEVVFNRPGEYAYTHHVDPTKCLEACSWRPGTRCYPGICNSDMLYPIQCTCAEGFEGSDCATFSSSAIEKKLRINNPEMTLIGKTKLIVPDPTYPTRKVWTNEIDWWQVSLEVLVTFAAPDISQESRDMQTYIDFMKTRIGISEVTVNAVLTRGNSRSVWENELNCSFNATCKLSKKEIGIGNIPWNDILQGGYPTPFVHLDNVDITIALTNGGTVYFTNIETNESDSYGIIGKTATRTLELGFDLLSPVHCMENTQPCDTMPLFTPDFVDEMTFEVSWDSWEDGTSGIRLYRLEVFLLEVFDQNTGILKSKGSPSFQIGVNVSERSAWLNVSEPGPYSVEMSAVDLAGNEKTSRRLFIFDDQSEVDLTGHPPIVATADPQTDYQWINKDADKIEVMWPDRFINERHCVKGWLNEVAITEHIAKELDDTPGMSERTTASVHNIQGIVRFTVAYNISYGFDFPGEIKDPITLDGILLDEQRTCIDEGLTDGKRLTFFLRGYDVFGKFAEDKTTVTIDLSPPVIENMWLTRGDMYNITVHSEEELYKLTVEWEAFDIHSGLLNISWRIFDNFTKTDKEHGTGNEAAQNLEECEEKYDQQPRGAKCYCTPFNGCFHKHYQLKPRVTTSDSDGLFAEMDKGAHESDYFIEVRAVNNALLETVVSMKVTIDTSPPHSGSVHDGYPGQAEVDFQQSYDLTSYWDGFFDKESSVWFYVYGYSTECLPSSEFDIDQSTANTSQTLIKTYSTNGRYKPSSPGKYYVTVVAFNHALDHSEPVCSDGVTVDDTEVDVSDVIVKGSVTRPGLLKDSSDRVWLLRRDRVRMEIRNPSSYCIKAATLLSDIDIAVLPVIRHLNGTVKDITGDICLSYNGVHTSMVSFVTSDDHLHISWNVTNPYVSIHDFEVGLSSGSSSPDMIPFMSARQHQHIRLVHPNILNGEEFFIIIRTITKAAVIKDTLVGPFVADTTKPDFQGTIHVDLENCTSGRHLVVTWQHDTFIDHGDPATLIVQVALGSTKYGHDVLPFQGLSPGCSCKSPVTCTSINTDRLSWHLHGHQRYYVTVKASNTVGMFTLASSSEYVHNVELPSAGVVYDIDLQNDALLQDIVDIDFQSHPDTLSSRWSGFFHPHVNVTFIVCIKKTNSSASIQCEDVGQKREHTFSSLSLLPFTTYVHHVTAITEAGNLTVSSDGVTVIVENTVLPDITVKDGPGCSSFNDDKAFNIATSHHSEDKRVVCEDDIDFQASSDAVQARWTVPRHLDKYTPDVYWAIEERAPIADIWDDFRSFEHLKTSRHLSESNLALMAGRNYRVVLKFCATKYCFMPVRSNGFTVLQRPPTPSPLIIRFDNASHDVHVQFGRFYDPDVEDADEARDTVVNYEWALTDNSGDGRLLTKWQTLNQTDAVQADLVIFSIPVSPNITFTKCWKIAVRGYNKAGLSSVVSNELRSCIDASQVRAHVIIDAVGQHVTSKDPLISSHNGPPITMSENSEWNEIDKDFTTFTNVLSAVWPTLRYPSYVWAVLELHEVDPSIFYHSEDMVILDPCNHPDAIKCGRTELEYMNAWFNEGELVHGKRYITCVQADAAVLQFEKWQHQLEDFHACSDGITVDLTPPIPSAVWIGNKVNDRYQTSSTCLTVNWQSFVDVEEEGHSAHISGVESYQVAIGSAHGGVDIVDFVTVGLTNHHMFHGLHLQNGHSYFATVKATDFTGQTAMKVSPVVLLDTSPPVTTGQSIMLAERHITDTGAVSACWNDVFTDPESGLSHFEWSVGSQRGYDDVMPYTWSEGECGISESAGSLNLFEGHAYFVSVKAYNYVGKFTLAVSWAFTVDASAPTAGYVYDGPRRQDGSLHDVDYIDKTSVIEAHWSEFYEVHGTVKEYEVSVGSCKGCDDLLPRQPNGISQDILLKHLKLSEGQRYYVTVTACNTANLCTSSTSDGILVDKTPPIAGRVLDGLEGKDIQYQASRLFIGAKWFGFIDGQSGISHYVWRAGTSPGSDDILPATEVHKLQEAFIVDLSVISGKGLPVDVRVYITVRAYNRAGMSIESTSNGFVVDTSHPIFTRHISSTNIGSAKPNTSVLPRVIRVEWEVTDDESFIDEQYLSIVSHIGGDFNASSIRVDGIVRDYTFSDLDLHDGSVYSVTLVSCNGARMCSETKLDRLLVDSSHPTPGMFAINTDHSATPDRQPGDGMTWKVTDVRLAWLGFTDVHSGIDHYFINIGSTFMGNDLHMATAEPNIVVHDNNVNETAEGLVQAVEIPTKPLAKIRTLFVSIWAINGVGLPSPIVHHEFELAFGGSMELVRRCDAHTCLGHCVCAPHGELCHTDKLCTDISNVSNNNIISVKYYTDLRFPADAQVIDHSPTQTLSAARWSIEHEQGKEPLWYEWSIGESMYNTPKGVFDIARERIWHDAAQNLSWIFSHSRDKYLREKKTYSFFVRAWYDTGSFAIFKSPGVLVYTTRPKTVSVQGIRVKETLKAGGKDVDFIDVKTPFIVDWTGKFSNTQYLSRFHLYISTTPGGHNTYCINRNLLPTVTRFNFTGYQFETDTVYYSVVQAYNMAGLHTTETSDGFMMDGRSPTPGVVHDGEVFIDLDAINSSHVLPLFWYGFSDFDSGIRGYNVCLTRDTDIVRCQAHPTTDVGLKAHAKLFPNMSFSDGTRLFGEVQAFDFVGHSMPHVRSDGVIVDTSPPRRSVDFTYQNNQVQNPSFEVSDLDHTLRDTEQLTKCDNRPPPKWIPTNHSCVLTVEAGKDQFLIDGQRFVVITGAMQQQLGNLTVGAKYRLRFFSSHIPIKTAMLSSCDGYVMINQEKHVFMMYRKPTLSEDNPDSVYSLSWHEHTYFFVAKTPEVTMTIGTEGMTNHLALDNIMFEQRFEYLSDVEAAISGHVKAKTVFMHDWSSLHAEWNFIDDHSEIVEYLWAIGTVEGGTQLQPFKSVGKRTFAFTSSLRLTHNTKLYVTVSAVNQASLRTVSYSDPILIDLTPPRFRMICDGPMRGKDIDFQRGLTVYANWEIEDPESDIAQCSWTLYTGTGEILLKSMEDVKDDATNVTTDVQYSDLVDDMVYVTVTCTNNAGWTSHMKSDGVKIVTRPPSADNVLLEIIGSSETQYPVHDLYHGRSSQVRFRWTGFEDDDGIDIYLVALDGQNIHIEEFVSGNTVGFTYTSFIDLDLPDGNYTVSVTAINQLEMYSHKRSKEFILLTAKPIITGTTVAATWIPMNHELKASWEGVFTATCPLYYEVTVSCIDGGDGDIVQWEETKDTTLDISLNLENLLGPGITVRVSVRAITPAGQFDTAERKLFITN